MTNQQLLGIFMTAFDEHWQTTLAKLRIEQAQLTGGSRLRPLMVFWGYQSVNYSQSPDQLSTVADVAVSIELLHKASLLIDDWIDQDRARHGHPSFHIEYSPELAVVLAIYMVAESIARINHLEYFESTPPNTITECLSSIIQVAHSMSEGAYKELTLQKETLFNAAEIKKISELETSQIISYALVIGYYLGGGTSKAVADIFCHIGHQCGYMFQALNDVEVFANPKKHFFHKNKSNYDVCRKNIAVATLNSLATPEEQILISSFSVNDICTLMKKYKVVDFFLSEMTSLYKYMHQTISGMNMYGLSNQWSDDFWLFLLDMREMAESRLA